MEIVPDSWGIKKSSDEQLIALLRDPLACEGAVVWAMRETLARLIVMGRLSYAD